MFYVLGSVLNRLSNGLFLVQYVELAMMCRAPMTILQNATYVSMRSTNIVLRQYQL